MCMCEKIFFYKNSKNNNNSKNNKKYKKYKNDFKK